jgi:hypothetical protein
MQEWRASMVSAMDPPVSLARPARALAFFEELDARFQ